MVKRVNPIYEYKHNNRVKLIHGGADYFNTLKKLIESATHTIHLQTYIFDDDDTGNAIANTLINAANKGVQIFIVADGFASQGLSSRFLSSLKDSGIHFRYFEPLLRSKHFYFGRRMHHKIFVADDKFALIGGINISDKYNDIHGISAWKDMAVLFEGEAVEDAVTICRSIWIKSGFKFPLNIDQQTTYFTDKVSVRISENDWVKGKQRILRTYINLFSCAQESITIMCSYFIPGRVLRKQLSKAVKRGVKVRVIVAGPSDVMVAKYAERYLYDWMFRHNIEVYEYQPTILHAKVTVVDDHWVTIGSFNINNISSYASMELNADIRNKPFAGMLRREMDMVIEKDCIAAKPLVTKFSFLKKLLQRISYEFIRVMFNLSTFYFRQQE